MVADRGCVDPSAAAQRVYPGSVFIYTDIHTHIHLHIDIDIYN